MNTILDWFKNRLVSRKSSDPTHLWRTLHKNQCPHCREPLKQHRIGLFEGFPVEQESDEIMKSLRETILLGTERRVPLTGTRPPPVIVGYSLLECPRTGKTSPYELVSRLEFYVNDSYRHVADIDSQRVADVRRRVPEWIDL